MAIGPGSHGHSGRSKKIRHDQESMLVLTGSNSANSRSDNTRKGKGKHRLGKAMDGIRVFVRSAVRRRLSGNDLTPGAGSAGLSQHGISHVVVPSFRSSLATSGVPPTSNVLIVTFRATRVGIGRLFSIPHEFAGPWGPVDHP
jgi:hypothetical protein